MIDVLLLGRILRCGRRTQSFYCVQDDGHALDRVSKHDWLEHQPFFQGVIRFMNQTNLESQTLFYHNFHKKVIYIRSVYLLQKCRFSRLWSSQDKYVDLIWFIFELH
jgi:hypothetical protein